MRIFGEHIASLPQFNSNYLNEVGHGLGCSEWDDPLCRCKYADFTSNLSRPSQMYPISKKYVVPGLLRLGWPGC